MKGIAYSIAVSGVLGGALVFAVPVAAQSSTFVAANLLGQDVPGGKGDADADADFNGELKPKDGKICYYLDSDGLDDADAVHIHRKGDAGTDAPVATLKMPGPDGDEVCADADPAAIEAIAKAPGDYDIDIHTPGHPEGAARGRLKK